MLKTVNKRLISAVSVLAAIASVGAWFAPTLGSAILSRLAHLVTIQAEVPAWLLLLLCLALVAIGGIVLRNWWRLRNPSKCFPRVTDLSLNELLVIEAIYQLDGESAYPSNLAQQLKLTKLELDVALQSLENQKLLHSMLLPVVISSSIPKDLTSYFFSAEGTEFAVTAWPQLQAAISLKKTKPSKK